MPIKTVNNFFFCRMAKNTANNTSGESGKISQLDKYVCNFIQSEWLSDGRSNLAQSNDLGLHPHVTKKIKEADGYRIPLSTLGIICFYKKISLSEFFKAVEKKYGGKLNEDLAIKSKK